MKYVNPIGKTGDRAPYVDADPANGIEGDAVSSDAWEHPMLEIENVIVDAGITPDSNDLAQLNQAIDQKIAAGATPVSDASETAKGIVELATQAEMDAGAAGLVPDADKVKTFVDNLWPHPLLHVQDQKAAGTDGGQYATGSFQTHDVNTVLTNEITGAVLATNQVTLPAGDYFADIMINGWATDEFATRLYDVTNSAVLLLGMTDGPNSNSNITSNHRSPIRGRFFLAGATTIEFQHRQTVAGIPAALGLAHGFQTEVYLDAVIIKVG